MKITKRQLKRIIRESYMKQLYGEIENMIMGLVDPEMGDVIHVDNMINAWRREFPEISIEQLWGVVEMMEADGRLESEGSSGYYHVPSETPMNEMWMATTRVFSPMASRADPEFAALIKGIVMEVVEDDDDKPNPFGTGNTPVLDPDAPYGDLIGHT
jgi:hypothetical protein